MSTTEQAALISWDLEGHAYETRKGSVRALGRVSTTVRRSEFISIVGPSGCGKSTLLLLTAGLMSPREGRILIDGAEVTGPYSDMSMTFQQDLLLEWRSCLSNVLLHAEIKRMDKQEAKKSAMELLRRTGLSGFEESLPRELSGGMRQRVALCRALLTNPHLLLMDEPFGALDALTRRKITRDLEQLFLERQKTVLFVTHDIDEAVLLGDRVLVFSDRPGAIIADVEIDVPRPRGRRPELESKLRVYAADIQRIFESYGIL